MDFYFSVMSPWAHLGFAPFLEIAARHGVEIGWKPLPLGPLFGETGGVPLAQRPVQRRDYRDIELQRWAAKRGRPVKLRPKHWPFPTRLADCVVIALVAQGEDPSGFVGAAMRGVWEEDRDLGDPQTIAELLKAGGHAAGAIIEAADGDDAAAVYEATRIAAQTAGVFGSPTYMLDGEPFWGQDRLDLLDEALTSGRPPYRAVSSGHSA